jgi:crotonobetainyl-CoA:carnitine CoA-transferase CaiB-like acyl-CoA transferase
VHALDGLLVLDMGRILAAPWAAQMLADLGADVIKIEQPGKGAGERLFGARASGQSGSSGFHNAVNRNKRSIVVDLTNAAGQDVVRRLAARADILIENFIPGTMARFGLDYETLQAINPGLIYCSLTGYGQTGPYSARPGYDAVFQAQSGLMAVTGLPDGEPGGGPMKTGPSLVDVAAGYNAVIGILAALRHRDTNGGGGQHIDVALLDTAMAMQTHCIADYLITGEQPARKGTAGNGGHPARVYQCGDGQLYVSVGRDAHFHAFCRATGCTELIDDPRFKTNPMRYDGRAELDAIIEPILATGSAADWAEALIAARVPCSVVNTYTSILADPHVRQRGIEVQIMGGEASGPVSVIANPIRLSRTPVRYDRPAPVLDADGRMILRDILGMSDAAIDALAAAGALGEPVP